MSKCTPQKLFRFAIQRLNLRRYIDHPGDGRLWPQIPAKAVVWALLIGRILRKPSFHSIEWLMRSPARRAMEV